jgi:hypothetical protein
VVIEISLVKLLSTSYRRRKGMRRTLRAWTMFHGNFRIRQNACDWPSTAARRSFENLFKPKRRAPKRYLKRLKIPPCQCQIGAANDLLFRSETVASKQLVQPNPLRTLSSSRRSGPKSSNASTAKSSPPIIAIECTPASTRSMAC